MVFTEPTRIKPPGQGLRVEGQRTGGEELLSPEERAALDVPAGRTKLDVIRERKHLFAHMAEATNTDTTIAKPHVQALENKLVTIHGHTYQFKQLRGRGYTGIALKARRLDTNATGIVKLTRPYDHKRLNESTVTNPEEADAIHMARGMMNEVSSLHTLTRDAHGQPLQRQGGEPPFPILLEAQLLHDPSSADQTTDMRMGAAVLEEIEGTGLDKMIRQTGHLRDQIDRVKKISLGLVRATRRMHEAGVLHLDLKSRNVIVTEEDDPIILDFGSSQQPSKWAGTSTGKPIRWAEPLSKRIITQRYTTRQDQQDMPRKANDVYSLGITLQDIVYGFDDTIDQTAIKAALTPELQVLDAVIQQMTNADPDQRPDLVDIENQLRNGWQALEDIAAEADVRKQIAS